MSMNVVQIGDRFQIYGDSLKTYNELPVGTYEVAFSQMMGFSLVSHNDPETNEEKIYGATNTKVEKILRGFQNANRNFGVILSGRKGVGKSLFARQLALRAKDFNLPLILVSEYTPGISNFLSSIEQEVIVLFDEFEKTFADQDGRSPQEEMLSLFDGIDCGKKLFVVTCNVVNKLNDYLINRPGRFHYHFILGSPTADEIREYITDKLVISDDDVIKRILQFAVATNVTYDILRAIVFELNNGYSIEETLMDLNISKEKLPEYEIAFKIDDGTIYTVGDRAINPYSGENVRIWAHTYYKAHARESMRFDFEESAVVIDPYTSCLTLDPDDIEIHIDEDDFDMDNPKEKARFDYLCNARVTDVQFRRIDNHFDTKYIV